MREYNWTSEISQRKIISPNFAGVVFPRELNAAIHFHNRFRFFRARRLNSQRQIAAASEWK